MRRTVASLLGALPVAAVASVPGAPRVALGDQLVQVLGGLALVLALLGVLAWALKRVNQNRVLGGRNLRLVGGIALGARERIVVVEVGETQLVVGVAPGRVQTLHVLDQPLQAPAAEGAEAPSFGARLAQLMNREKEK
jgi:flagellar protein FliO/FliZ